MKKAIFKYGFYPFLLLAIATSFFFYLKAINIYESVSIQTNSKTDSDSIYFIGTSPLGRDFVLPFSKTDNCWKSKNYYLKSLYVIIPSKYTAPQIVVNQKYVLIHKSTKEASGFNKFSAYQIDYKSPDVLIEKMSFILFDNSANRGIFIVLVFIILFLLIFRRSSYFSSSKMSFFCASAVFNLMFLLLIILLVYLSRFSYPANEDFIVTHYASQKGFGLPIFYYRLLDGRYLTNFLYFIINPVVYKSLLLYKFIPIVLTALLWISMWLIVRFFAKTETFYISFSITNVLICQFLLFIPDISFAIFWMFSAYVYTILIIFCNLLILVTLYFLSGRTNSISLLSLLSIIVVLMNGISELSIILLTLWSIFYLGWLIYTKQFKLYHLSPIILFVATSLIILLAPGNKNSFLLQNELSDVNINWAIQIFKASINSLGFSLIFIKTKLGNIFFLMFILFSLPIFHKLITGCGIKLTKSNSLRIFTALIFLTILVPTLIIFPLFFSHIGVNYTLPVRIQNIAFFFFLIPFVLLMVFLYDLIRTFLSNKAKPFLAIIIFSASILFVLTGSTNQCIFLTDLYHDIRSERLSRHEKMVMPFMQELISANKSDNECLMVIPIDNPPKTIYSFGFKESPMMIWPCGLFFQKNLLLFYPDSTNQLSREKKEKLFQSYPIIKMNKSYTILDSINYMCYLNCIDTTWDNAINNTRYIYGISSHFDSQKSVLEITYKDSLEKFNPDFVNNHKVIFGSPHFFFSFKMSFSSDYCTKLNSRVIRGKRKLNLKSPYDKGLIFLLRISKPQIKIK